MRTTRVVFARCLRAAALPTAAATAVAAIAAAVVTSRGGPDVAAALQPWLHVPAVAALLCCVAATVDLWPAFALGRPGADWVRSRAGPPLYGCAAATGGAALALLVLLAPLPLLTAPFVPPPAEHRLADLPARPLLDGDRDRLDATLAPLVAGELRLRPIAVLVADPQPTEVRVSIDGDELPEPLRIAATGQLVRIPLAPPRSVRTVTMHRTAGNLTLVFPPGSVEVVAATPRSRVANGAIAYSFYLVPCVLALAFATLLGALVFRPVAFAVVLTALLLTTVGGLGPVADGILMLVRGRWLPDESLFGRGIASLGTALVAMIAAMLVRRRLLR